MIAIFLTLRLRRAFLSIVGSVLFLTVNAASANCSRADVDHFLSRGFTPEQVVLLCGGESSETEPEVVVDESTEAERDLRELLLRSVNAKHVDLDANHLKWQDELCAEYAPPNLAGRPRERCGPVTIEAARNAVKVGEVRKQVLFFGEHGVELVGHIEQDWKIETEGLSAADRRRLKENSPAVTDSALLPLHDRADPDEIAVALRRWIQAGQ